MFSPVASCSPLPGSPVREHVPRPAIGLAPRVSWLWLVGMQQAREAGLMGKAASGGVGRPCVFAAVPLPGKKSSNCLNATLSPCPLHPYHTLQ